MRVSYGKSSQVNLCCTKGMQGIVHKNNKCLHRKKKKYNSKPHLSVVSSAVDSAFSTSCAHHIQTRQRSANLVHQLRFIQVEIHSYHLAA